MEWSPIIVVEQRKEQVIRIAKALIGDFDDVIFEPYGHAGIPFEVLRSNGELIVEAQYSEGAFGHIEQHIQVLSGIGVAVPQILQKGTFEGFSYLVLRKIPGKDLGYVLGDISRLEMFQLAEQVVAIKRKVNQFPEGSGFGWTPLDVPSPFSSWTAVIQRDSPECAAEVQRAVALSKSYFDSIRPVCFLNDLTGKNVIVLDRVFQGIVDLDQFSFGDPLFWSSLADVTARLDVGEDASFYGDKLPRLWDMMDEVSHACDLYNAIQALYGIGGSLTGAAALPGQAGGWNPSVQPIGAFGSNFKIGLYSAAPGWADANQVTFAAVPEPGTMAALGLGALAMLRRRKKA
jgi:hypothetical protein